MIILNIRRMKTEPEIFRHHGGEMHLLREIARTHQVMMNAFSREIGVPASQATLMRLIATANGGIGVTDLAAELGVNAAGVTRQVQLLEAEGLVRRRTDSRDARRNYVTLSARGEKLFRELHERSHEMERLLVEAIGAKELTAAADVLAKLRSFVEGYIREHSRRNAIQ